MKLFLLPLLSVPFLLAAAGSTPEDPEDLLVSSCTGHVGNFVWYDVDGNGIQDLGEPGIGGVSILLRDAQGNLIDQTVSFPNGWYRVGGDLCAETFTLEYELASVPPGLVPTPCDVGTNDTIDSDCSPITFTLPDDTHHTIKFDFGFTDAVNCSGIIGDFVWHDLDADGLQDPGEPGIEGVVLNLEDAAGNILASTATDQYGMYFFPGLCAGTYVVTIEEITLPPGMAPSLCNVGVDDTIDNDCSPAVVVLSASDSIDIDTDFGFVTPVAGNEGCTPGYWKQKHHFDSWPSGYQPTDLFSDYFDDAFPGKTLLEVLRTGGGGLWALGRHTVAALLNAEAVDVNYGLTTTDVVNEFNDLFPATKPDYNALKNYFEGYNTAGCPLR